jgi:DNA-binding response OmpR family regulator
METVTWTVRTTSTRPAKVLVVDDEEPIRTLVRGYLEREGLEALTAADGPSAVEAVRREQPDVVVLDLNLPGLDGIEVCRQLRTFSSACVIMLTARGEEVDRIVGLSIGADDYLVKPFSPRELMARIHALLRRPRTADRAAAAGLEVDVARHQVAVDGTAIALTPIEFALLAALARVPGVVITRAELMSEVWGSGYDDHLHDVHVAKLRRKIGDEPARPRVVETVRGVGFRLAER